LTLTLTLPVAAQLSLQLVSGSAGKLAMLLTVGGLGFVAALALARGTVGPLVQVIAAATAIAWPLLDAPASVGELVVALERDTDPSFGRVAVIGIDGADWRVIDPLLESGDLPHLQALIDRGVHGTLISTEPSISSVVWTSIFSGATPEQHGIVDWQSSVSTNRRVPLLWELVTASGGRSIVVNVPGTWPPAELSGVMVAGFPLPQLVAQQTLGGQFVGTVLSSPARAGSVPTISLQNEPVRLTLGRVPLEARSRVRHALVELAARKHWLGETVSVELVHLGGDRFTVDGRPIDLQAGRWSAPLALDVSGDAGSFRLRRLEDGSLYATPPFQSSLAPRYPIATGLPDPGRLSEEGNYIVEGGGWKAAADPDLREAVFEHLVHVHERHAAVARDLARDEWDLFACVYTLTDRVQHAFWPFHDPAGFESPAPAGELRAHGDKVREAYRLIDAEIGLLRPLLPEDVTLLVLSDHGTAPDPARGCGGHRKEGIFILSGPSIVRAAERRRMSIYDIGPTLLAGLGLPLDANFEGTPQVDLFSGDVHDLRRVDGYLSAPARSRSREVAPTTIEQLRSLGYVE
jgi:hypothetical protein